MDSELSELAYHEAGHAVVAAWLGAEILSVTLEPDLDDGPRREGDAAVRWRHGVGGGAEVDLCLRELMAALAGPVVEMIYTGRESRIDHRPQWASDWQLAGELAQRLTSSPAQIDILIETTVRRLRALAAQDAFWQTIAEVADLLEAHQTVSGEEIHACLARWLEQ